MTNAELLANVVVPVASPEDASATALALEPYSPGDVTVLYVVEKGEGVPDKTPVEQSEGAAAESFAAFHDVLPQAETEAIYRRDVVDAILDVATTKDASAIVFRPRGGSRLVQFLAGDRALGLVTDADRPVVALPESENG